MRCSGDSEGTNRKIDDLANPVLHIIYCFYWKNKYSKVLNGDVHKTPTGSNCETSRGPNDGTFSGRPWDIGHTCFLNLTQKHIKLILTGYSRLYSELREGKIQWAVLKRNEAWWVLADIIKIWLEGL